MKQLVQNTKTGSLELTAVPDPAVAPGQLLIRTTASLVSAGTERATIAFGQQGPVARALRKPAKVKQVVDRARRDGIGPTVRAVRNAFDRLQPLGYCNVGTVVAIGDGVSGFALGQRVASNGPHAEIVSVPFRLCAAVPSSVSDSHAAFTVQGAIALHSMRLAEPTIGETFCVVGLGLIGLLSVQLLRAQGCNVMVYDPAPERLAMAVAFGARPLHDPAGIVAASEVDGVIIAAQTDSNDPIELATRITRKRGRIILVGTSGFHFDRQPFYDKELAFQVACSYGPGRYDDSYELLGHDYPLPYVRWTEQRNFAAILDILEQGRIDVSSLIDSEHDFVDAVGAMARLAEPQPPIGMIFRYASAPSRAEKVTIRRARPRGQRLRAAVIGPGAYATSTLIPALEKAGAALGTVASRDGRRAVEVGRRFGFENAVSEAEAAIRSDADLVVISTRHHDHADLVVQALQQGKNTFVEKPLAINMEGLEKVDKAMSFGSTEFSPILMVGFNRRFSPFLTEAASLIAEGSQPVSIIVTVNAGFLSQDHWTRQPDVGGGRLIGEGCHFIDASRFLAASPIVAVQAVSLGDSAHSDSAMINLRFANGSIAAILYLTNGHPSVPKERIEVTSAGSYLRIDNFTSITRRGWNRPGSETTKRQNKGNEACIAAFVEAVRSGSPSPIPLEELIEVTKYTLLAQEHLMGYAE